MKGTNRHAREAAMQCLYEMDITGENPIAESEPVADDSTVAEQSEATREVEYAAEDLTDDDRQFVENVLEYFPQHQESIDAEIARNSHKWKLDRISKVDLAILRLAVYEIMYLHTPPRIAINEAVELAKTYSSEKSYQFVNGVLAGYARTKER